MNLREDGDPEEEEGKERTRGTTVTQKEIKDECLRKKCRPKDTQGYA